MSKHWLFSFIDSAAGHGAVSLASEFQSEAQENAYHIYGYLKSYGDILHAPETAKVVMESVR